MEHIAVLACVRGLPAGCRGALAHLEAGDLAQLPTAAHPLAIAALDAWACARRDASEDVRQAHLAGVACQAAAAGKSAVRVQDALAQAAMACWQTAAAAEQLASAELDIPAGVPFVA